MTYKSTHQKPEKKKSTSSLEEALIASEIRYRRLFESAKEGILILDAETGMIVDVNPFLINLLGYSKENFVEKSVWELGFLKDIIQNKEKFLELQQKEYVRYEDLPLETTNGKTIHVEFVSNVYLVKNQKAIQCNIRDITKRKELETGQEKNRIRLAEIKKRADEESTFTENIINTVREPLLVLDEELRVIKASRSFYTIFKVKPDNTIGRLIYDLGNQQWNIPKLRELLEKILPEKTSFDNYEVEHDFSSIGTRIMLLNARQIRRGLGKEKIILLAFEDVTERKRKERSLSEKSRLTNEYLKILLEHAHAPIITWDASMLIKRFNPEFEKLSGYNKSEVQNKKIEILFPENEVASTLGLLKNTIGDEKQEIIEINILTKDKEIKTVLWNSANISDEEGKKTVATIAQDITYRKRSEEAWRKSEIRYRRLFESAKDGILILDADTGMIIDVNPFLINLLGYSKESFMQKAVWEIGFFHDIVQNKEKFQELQQKEYVRYEDLPLETTDGRTIHVEFVSNTYLEDGQKVIQCNIRDITERTLSEKKIIDGHKMLRTLIDNLPAMIYIKDIKCRKVIANIADVNNIGYQNEEEILGKTDSELFPGIIGQRGYADDQMVISSGMAIIDRIEDFIDREGKRRWVSTTKIPLKNIEGEITGLVGIGHDITERRKLVTNLSTATEIAKLGYWEFDVISGNFIFDDQYYRLIHGSSTEKQGGNEMSVEKFAKRLVHPDDSQKIAEKLQEAISSADPEYLGQAEARVFRDNGEITNVKVLFKAEKDDTGRAIKVVGINQDITQQKRFEQELRHAKEKAEESDRLKSAFLANMSHEIRTPMNGILGFTELLKEPKLSGEQQQEFIHIIEKSGARMLNIINDIINISRIESGQVETTLSNINVNEQIEEIINFFKPEAAQKKLDFFYTNPLPANVAAIKTDKEKVYAVLTNLVKNALKFTQTGSIELGCAKKGKFLEFFVKDTGVGINREQENFIFKRFRQGSESLTRGYEGAGLGLAISKAYVEILGGKISIESYKEQGSTFRFTIPYRNRVEEKERLIAIPGEEILIPRKLKILIAEDDETSGMLLKLMTKSLTRDFLLAITGKQAVEICRTNPNIDLVLMDINMPDMDGYEATRQIREFNKEVIIIAQTAHVLTGDREKSIEAGCNDNISKPIDQVALIEMIEKHLRPKNV